MRLFLLCILILTPFSQACAEEVRATVRLDGRALFRVGALEGAEEPQERARRIERRLNALLENPKAIPPARIETTGPAEKTVSIAGRPVVTVTSADAQENALSTGALAIQWAQAIDTALQRASSRRLSPWGRFAAEVQGSIQTAFARLLESGITVIPRALAAMLVIGFFWGVATLVRWTMRLVFRRIISDLTVENLLKQIAYYAVWVLGLFVAAHAFGIEPEAVAAGLGLSGLVLGFALKDILSNFVSGLIILTTRPFVIGDQIIVGDTEGSIERIELRATQIRTYDGRIVLVPNAEVLTSRVTNNTAAPVRRGAVQLFVGYRTDLQCATRVIRDAAQRSDGVLPEPLPSVRIRELGAADILLEVRFWTDSRRSDYVATSSAVRQEIVEALHRAGVDLPEPDVRSLVPRHPEKWWEAIGGRVGSRSEQSD